MPRGGTGEYWGILKRSHSLLTDPTRPAPGRGSEILYWPRGKGLRFLLRHMTIATTPAAAPAAPMAIPALALVDKPAEEDDELDAVPVAVLDDAEAADAPVAVESTDEESADVSEAEVVSAADAALAVDEA